MGRNRAATRESQYSIDDRHSKQQRWWNRERERLRGLEIDDQIVRGGLFDGKAAGGRASQNLVDVIRGPPTQLGLISPVGHQGAGLRVTPRSSHQGKTMLHGEVRQPTSMSKRHRVRKDQDPLSSFPVHGPEGLIELVGASYVEDLKLDAGQSICTPKTFDDERVPWIVRIRQQRNTRSAGNR